MNLAKDAQALKVIEDIKLHSIHKKDSKLKIGIVINSRLSSSRIPRKALSMINGKPMIQHLVERLKSLDIPIVIAVPTDEFMQYSFLHQNDHVYIHRSIHSEDPLARMYEVALVHGFDYVVRITHDKIFIDTALLAGCIKYDLLSAINRPDYLYLNNSIPGTAFEIISTKSLSEAASKFKEIEFIGYAIRQVTTNIKEIDAWKSGSQGIRLLVDYPNDLNLMHVLFSQLGNDCTLNQVISYLLSDPHLKYINKLPEITIYTCAFNADKWIARAISSVVKQVGISFEYLLIDDFSSDRTPEIMALAGSVYPSIRFIRNEKNIGLSSSSNIALTHARGRYIIRLDADDEFSNSASLMNILSYAKENELEITYPDYISIPIEENEATSRHSGNEFHHIGGALFDKDALNYVKFTEGLRAHDSLDVWTRARSFIKYGYYSEVGFIYHQINGSLSRINLEERDKIKETILNIESSNVN